jgi:hypothetical protein
MRTACWITKATNRHSELVVFAFPLQKWLHERASLLHYMYSVCLICTPLRWLVFCSVLWTVIKGGVEHTFSLSRNTDILVWVIVECRLVRRQSVSFLILSYTHARTHTHVYKHISLAVVSNCSCNSQPTTVLHTIWWFPELPYLFA